MTCTTRIKTTVQNLSLTLKGHLKMSLFLFGLFQAGLSADLSELVEKYASDKGCYSEETHCYTSYYETIFSGLRQKELKILEIGVAYGGSIRMWLDYFPNSSIYGVDLFPDCLNIDNFEAYQFPANRVQLFKGSQNDPVFLKAVCEKIDGDLDIIIDDGSHLFYDQQVSLVHLFSKLKSGGLYIIEDFHCRPCEEHGVLDTRVLLRQIANNNSSVIQDCPYLSRQSVLDLLSSVDTIEWFDSAGFGKMNGAVIWKK